MSPTLATLLTLVGIPVLLYRQSKASGPRSAALWLPVMWLCVVGSRFVSQWMSLGEVGSDNYNDGSAIDAVYFLALICLGAGVLSQRRLEWKEIFAENKWLVLLLVYGFVSIAWSDFPFIAFKRWIKTLGHPVMALIILTDPDPTNAMRSVMKRCAFILLPLSMLFVKYLPQYGRGFDAWTGEPVTNGVGLTKNDLGYLCMVTGLFFVWNILTALRAAERRGRWVEIGVSAAFLWMAIWLIIMCNSATSLTTLMLGAFAMVVLGFRIVNKRRVGSYVIVSLLLLAGLESAFGLYAEVLTALGKSPTLTDRTVVWADVLALQDQPLLGFGFESFWLGSRLDVLWAKWWWKPNQAHNGYLETYLNFGAVGVFLLLMLLLSVFRKTCRQLLTDFDFARFRFGLLVAIIAFNFTEAAFKGVHFVWTIFHLIAIDCPKRTGTRRARPTR